MNGVEEYDKLALPMVLSLQVTGVWPSRHEIEGQHSLRVLFHRLHRFLVTILLILISGGVTTDVIVFFGEDMNETIECILITSAFYMCVTRMITFYSHQPEMLFVVETIREDWSRSSVEERAILRDKCLLGFKLSKFFSISVMFCIFAFITMPIVEMNLGHESRRLLPFRGYFFFNYSAPGVYQYAYLANSIVGWLGGSTIACASCFSLITSLHASAKFAIVQLYLEKMNKAAYWSNNELVGKCVRRHQESIRFAETVENIINVLALAQFLISTALLCFGGFQLTTMLQDKTRFTKYASFLNSATLELFLFSYSGQALKSESEDVAEFAYNSNWIGSLLSSNLRMIILRSRKPCTITAGKFYDMSLESFLKVISSSFSYFTVLMAMKEE